MSLSAIPPVLRVAVLERDDHRCQYCRLHQTGQGATFHIDHVIPRSKGGATVLENLAAQCPWCSLHKSDKTEAIDPKTGRRTILFHPLKMPWGTHFRTLQNGRCIGRTAIGRATVEALQMNDPLARMARVFQLISGLIE